MRRDAQPARGARGTSFGLWLVAALHQAASTGVLHRLEVKPSSESDLYADLSRAGGLNRRRLSAMLRLLEVGEIVQEVDGKYEVCEGVPVGSPELIVDREILQVLFDDGFLWGRSSTEAFFASLSPQRDAGFALTMERQLGPAGAAIQDHLAGRTFDRLIDVGGGTGLVARMLVATGNVRSAICVDKSVTALELGRKAAEAEGVADRIEFASIDFLNGELPEGDLYLLSRILHDWPDDVCHDLLINVSLALDAAGQLIVHEEMFDGMWWPAGLDFFLAAMLSSGRVRSVSAVHGLLEESDFRINETCPVDDFTWMVFAERS